MTNEIKDTKEKKLYFLNKLILSAFGETKEIDTTSIQTKVKTLEKSVPKDFIQAFDKKLESVQINNKEITESKAYQNLLNSEFSTAAFMFAELYKKDKTNLEYIKHLSSCLLQLKQPEIVKRLFLDELKKHTDDTEILKIVATTYFGMDDCFKEAIPYFEELIKRENNNYALFYQLSFLYERVYQNKELDKQIEYATKALEFAPDNNLVIAFLAKLYYRSGDKEKAKELFERMMKNNPTPEQQVLYSRMFLKEGDLKTGYEMYKVRFKTSNVAYPKELTDKTRWDGKSDISNSTVIVHYEQGFGDSVMFVRYLPRLSKIAKKVILVVQKNIIPILKSSGFDKYCEILSHEADINPHIKLDDINSSVMYTGASGMSKIPHDYHIPMMDLPYLFEESPDKMLEAGGYLSADKEKVEEFRKKYINSNDKIKIGLSYHGTKQSNSTYRDIKVKEFLPLFRLENVEFYSFQADEYAEELEGLPNDVEVKNLGKIFRNFEDTACAIECMDCVITTDNVVMNLAGAMGKKTFGLFNVFSECRWYKTEGENIGWYKSVKPLRAKNYNEWTPLINTLKNEIKKFKK